MQQIIEGIARKMVAEGGSQLRVTYRGMEGDWGVEVEGAPENEFKSTLERMGLKLLQLVEKAPEYQFNETLEEFGLVLLWPEDEATEWELSAGLEKAASELIEMVEAEHPGWQLDNGSIGQFWFVKAEASVLAGWSHTQFSALSDHSEYRWVVELKEESHAT